VTKPLTGIQRMFLLDAACGLTAAESARKHHTNEDTARNALKAARRKLGALSTTHAVALSLSLDIISYADVLEGN
jgi:DNA-binding NarL/FixJ family response regulator